MLFIVNAHAGKTEIKEKALDIIDIFIKAGYDVTVHTTQHPLETPSQIKRRGAEFDIIVVCGGDGTFNEAINGMMLLDKRIPLGYIPTGTVNDFASSLGISRDMLTAAGTIVAGSAFSCDMACFNNRYFTYVAAFGAFTEVSYETPQQTKNLIGRMAYILEGIKRLPSIRPVQMNVNWEGLEFSGDFLFGMITNTKSVGGFALQNISDLRMDDGYYEVTLVLTPKSLISSAEMLNSLIRLDMDNNSIITFKAKKVEFHSEDNVSWTLDGEFGGSVKDAKISVVKQAVDIIRKTDEEKFTDYERMRAAMLSDPMSVYNLINPPL